MTELDQLLTAVQKSTKYRHIAPDLIQRIGADELHKRRTLKEAVKATKNKLHQVGGAYQDQKIDYARALAQLHDAGVTQESCRELMHLHTSTRERLPILDDFYSAIFAELPPIHSIVDIASGLNPLAIPWMNLAEGARYTAVDIYCDMMQFLDGFFDMLPVHGEAHCCDVISSPPTDSVDLALILKTLPVLEQVDKTAVSHLLDSLNASHMLITFPLQSLGGRKKGMKAHYAEMFDGWVNGRSWKIQQFEFPTELAYLVTT